MKSNRLINQRSPYLLQHAHNPVDWYPWGDEALTRARKENKPVLISIGYSSCHWCHVMERESFEDEETAALMNAQFVCIKIDREERPDLDHVYMEAVQILTGSGGWPLNVFLTPDLKPFYGGTYYPPIPAHNRPSWKEVLMHLSTAFQTNRDEVEAQADKLMDYIHKNNQTSFTANLQAIAPSDELLSKSELEKIYNQLQLRMDKLNGGFEQAPKFLGTFSLRWLIWYSCQYKNEAALTHAQLSLNQMLAGGIYDQLGGGISRYSTDNRWLVPHFEKMLYDNALLLMALAEAYTLTKAATYSDGMHSIVTFLKQEMCSTDNLFYSALDADSEGVEGKFYVWDKAEIDAILGPDAALFNAFYQVSENGNWEAKNILHHTQSLAEFAASHQLNEATLKAQFAASKQLLLAVRNNRIRPLLDNKIQCSWNALLTTALCSCYQATGVQAYRELALKQLDSLLSRFKNPEQVNHIIDSENYSPGFLEDYAYLAEACIHAYAISGNESYLLRANELTKTVIKQFTLAHSSFFSFTAATQADIIIAKQEIYDGATPAANSVMNKVLLQLHHYFENPAYLALAQQQLRQIKAGLVQYPTSFANWAMNAAFETSGWNEITFINCSTSPLATSLQGYYLPNAVYLHYSSDLVSKIPVLQHLKSNETAIQWCVHQTCKPLIKSESEWQQVYSEQFPNERLL